MDAFDISASAMTAQRLRLDVIAANLANVNTTRKADGTSGAYRRRNVVFAPILQDKMAGLGGGGHFADRIPMPHGAGGSGFSSNGPRMMSFDNGIPTLKAGISHQADMPVTGVKVVEVAQDYKNPLKMVFDPTHPDANKDGYVAMPNINPVTEMVDMISATRAYEANVTVIQSAKAFGRSALEI